MRHGSLFSGIGGFDLAAEWMGWENVFHCEINPFGQKILKHYWPNAISYTDITKTDFSIHRGGIDILTGGFPCQPFSSAGKRKGTEDARHLWPEMLRAIREIQPRFVVGENVRGITNWNGGMVFDQVQADLEAEGFEVLPFLLPACAVNAPHRRDRVWFVAHACGKRTATGSGGCNESRQLFQTSERDENKQLNKSDGESRTTPNPQHDGRIASEIRQGMGEGNDSNQAGGVTGKQPAGLCEQELNTDTNNKRLEGGAGERIQIIEGGRNCNQNGITSRDSRRNWEGFPTQPPVCGGDDGLPSELSGITFSKHRKESIMAYGNAIVPQVAFELFKAIEATNTPLP